MAEKLLILGEYDHVAEDATVITASSSASARLGPANVKTMQPGKRWRAAGAAGETLTFDFGAEVDFDTVFIAGHNGSLDGTVQVEVAEAADFADPLHDETYELWPPLFGYGEEYGRYWGGYVPPSELGVFLPSRMLRLGQQHGARHLRLTFTDPSSPIGAFEAGKVMVGPGTTLAKNFGHGWQMDEVDPSTVTVTDGGATVVREAPIYPRLSFTLPALTRSEALTKIQTIKRKNGRHRPVVVSLFPDAAPSVLYRTTIYGLFSDYSPTTHARHDRAVQTFTIDGLV